MQRFAKNLRKVLPRSYKISKLRAISLSLSLSGMLISMVLADSLYFNDESVPAAIWIGRISILATHVATLASLGTYFAAYGDKLFGPSRGVAVVLVTVLQCEFLNLKTQNPIPR